MFTNAFRFIGLAVSYILQFALLVGPVAALLALQLVSANAFLWGSFVCAALALSEYITRTVNGGSIYYQPRLLYWVTNLLTFGALSYTLWPLVIAGLWLYVVPLTVLTILSLLDIGRRLEVSINYIAHRLAQRAFRKAIEQMLDGLLKTVSRY